MSRTTLSIFLTLVVSVILTSCETETESPSLDPENQIIIEGYVYANEPVNHIRVTKVHGEGEASVIPVNDAQVRLSQGNTSVELSLADGDQGLYHISDTNLVFAGEEVIILRVSVNGYTYRSETQFPPAISNLSISTNYINLGAVPYGQIVASLNWDPAPGAQSYGVFIKKHHSDTLYELPNLESATDGPLYSIHSDTGIDLFADHFSHAGNYHLYVTAVNEEYVKMYDEDLSSGLRGGPTNIQGGWGIFTAFNGEEVEITVE